MLYKYEDKFPEIAESVFIAPSADVIGNVSVGEDSSIWFSAVVRGDENSIRIGKGTNIQDNCTVHINRGQFSTEIGDYVTIGHNAVIHACKVGNYCLVGMGSVVLDGAEIGDYSIIGAGSLVTGGKKIPSGVLAVGSPVKIIRELTEEEKNSIKESAYNYIKYARKFK